jgi:hypothetical protein
VLYVYNWSGEIARLAGCELLTHQITVQAFQVHALDGHDFVQGLAESTMDLRVKCGTRRIGGKGSFQGSSC